MTVVTVQLGDKVRDPITGFTGIVTSRTEYLHGCVRFGVDSQVLNDGKPLKTEWFDEWRLEPMAESTGGPARSVAPSRDPS